MNGSGVTVVCGGRVVRVSWERAWDLVRAAQLEHRRMRSFISFCEWLEVFSDLFDGGILDYECFQGRQASEHKAKKKGS